MGLIRSLKRRLRNQKRSSSDDKTFASYDMTEIGDSNSDDSVEHETRSLPCPSQLSPRLLPSPTHKRAMSRPLKSVEVSTAPSLESCTSNLSLLDMSDKAKAILTEAFPNILFDDAFEDEDLSKYPDPDVYISGGSSDDADENDKGRHDKHYHRWEGLTIDTSNATLQPSKAGDNDEYLVSSPANIMTTCENMMPSPPAVQPSSSSSTKTLAHIFHEELSTLMEEDEGSDDDSFSRTLSELEDEISTDQGSTNPPSTDMVLNLDMSPMERSIRDRWNQILELTLTGQCADQHGVLDTAEI